MLKAQGKEENVGSREAEARTRLWGAYIKLKGQNKRKT